MLRKFGEDVLYALNIMRVFRMLDLNITSLLDSVLVMLLPNYWHI